MQSRNYQPNSYSGYGYRDSYVGQYASPKNTNSRIREQALSPSFQHKYPFSQKYSSPPQPVQRNMQSAHLSPPQDLQSDTLQYAQLRLTISQLRNSLQISNQNAQKLQQQVFEQRKKTFELTQIKKRLEQELTKMQFQFDRIANYESLEERQNSVKLETALRENNKINHQLTDLLEQNKMLKNQQRKLMTQINKIMRQRDAVIAQNQDLIMKIKNLDGDVKEVRKELEEQSHVFQGHTYRSQHVPTVIASTNQIPGSATPIEEVNYQMQSQKLLGDYQKLLVQNESMKRLYSQFYHKGSNEPQSSFFKEHQHQHQYQVPRQPEEQIVRSFSNQHIADKLNTERNQRQNYMADSPMFKTSQKQQLKQELQKVRFSAVSQIDHYYRRTVEQAKIQKKNALKLFIEEIQKNINVLGKMSENYLELRATIMEEAGVELPRPPEGLTGNPAMIYQMFRSVKQKAKNEGVAGLMVAVFRILTLMARSQDTPKILLDNMHHSVLKYIYKTANPS